jgi:glycosyltransferase involved in cell wall biosynthesis
MFQDLRHPFASLLSAVRLVRLCATFKPDIIHAHMMGGAVLAYLSAKLHGLPLVTTVHNSFDRHSVIMRLGDQVVAVSGAEKAQLIRKGYRPDRVSVVVNAPNHSPREDFLGAARTYTLARPCVTVICGLHRRKGVFDVIDAFHQVSDEFNEWHLYIAGEGPDSGLLQGKVASLGLAGRVTFLGFVSSPRPIFEQTDIFVLASYADPGSLSIGEARAAGCAIIATAVGGTPEMLDFGAAGMLVPPGEPGRMAAKMRLLMHDPAARSSIGAAARAGAATFDVDRLLARYDEVYIKAATCLRPSGALPA